MKACRYKDFLKAQQKSQIQVPTGLLLQYMNKMPRGAFFLYLLLHDMSDSNEFLEHTIDISYEEIMRRLKIPKKTLSRRFKILEKLKFIEICKEEKLNQHIFIPSRIKIRLPRDVALEIIANKESNTFENGRT